MSLPLRVRLTVWYVALLAALLAAIGTFLVLQLRVDLVDATDRSLHSRAEQISVMYRGGRFEFPDAHQGSISGEPGESSAAQILSPSGGVLASTGDTFAGSPMISPAEITRVLAGEQVLRTIEVRVGDEYHPVRILAIPAPGGQRAVILVADSLDQVEAHVSSLVVLLLLAGPAALAVAGAGGWWLARKALRPVDRITREAGEIGVDRLHDRVAVPDTSDELGRLARTLNEMLGRLEEGVAEKRRFVADASHELRTPLAIMRAELDDALGSSWPSAEAREVLASQAEEVDRMTRIVGNLLTLARIDEGRLELLRRPVDLGDIAEAVVAELRPLAEGKGIHLTTSGAGVVVAADRERLHQALGNLVDNAVKYTSAGGIVDVSVWTNHEEAGVSVRDSGEGIPPEALPRVFDRFFRVDASRSRSVGGSGLGLAIFQQVAEAHGGRVWVESEVGRGSSFSLAVPAPVSDTPMTPIEPSRSRASSS